MKKENIYLKRYAWPDSVLAQKVEANPDIIVVIPAHSETNLNEALQSLHHCHPPKGEVSVFIIVNESTNASEEVQKINKASLSNLEFVDVKFPQYFTHVKLPPKKAGVGLARKIGMDEAVRVFERNNKNGIIVCYDADCTCEPDYLQAIEAYYGDSKRNLGLVHYEHQLHGPNHEAIILYELFLRYYINGLRVSNYPYALQTLGSCITVRSSAYQKQGGMNTRKAGEDFYFIHKVTPLGGIGEINSTTIYPSDRVSERVPFGTGYAILNHHRNPDLTYPSYNPHIFEDLQYINIMLEEVYASEKLPPLPKSIETFYSMNDFSLTELISQSGSFDNFVQRYYRWWDGFRVLKYVHFARDQYYKNLPLQEGLTWLDQKLQIGLAGKSRETQLNILRKHDQSNPFYIK